MPLAKPLGNLRDCSYGADLTEVKGFANLHGAGVRASARQAVNAVCSRGRPGAGRPVLGRLRGKPDDDVAGRIGVVGGARQERDLVELGRQQDASIVVRHLLERGRLVHHLRAV